MRVQIQMLRKAWKHIRRRIKKQVRAVAQIRHLPRNLPEQCDGIITTNGHLRIAMPLDPPLMREVAGIFRLAGYEVSDYEPDQYGIWVEANAKRDDDWAIYLTGMKHRDGSTCTLDLVGEETETKKVYEVVCNDGSKEKVFV